MRLTVVGHRPSIENHPRSAREILKENNLEKLTLRIPEQYRETTDFMWAMERALASLFGDSSDSESPLEVAGSLSALRDALDQSSSVLSLMTPSDFLTDEGLPKPEGGETLDSAWIFHLAMPTLSDHSYWIIVPRFGDKKPYNYGFN